MVTEERLAEGQGNQMVRTRVVVLCAAASQPWLLVSMFSAAGSIPSPLQLLP